MALAERGQAIEHKDVRQAIILPIPPHAQRIVSADRRYDPGGDREAVPEFPEYIPLDGPTMLQLGQHTHILLIPLNEHDNYGDLNKEMYNDSSKKNHHLMWSIIFNPGERPQVELFGVGDENNPRVLGKKQSVNSSPLSFQNDPKVAPEHTEIFFYNGQFCLSSLPDGTNATFTHPEHVTRLINLKPYLTTAEYPMPHWYQVSPMPPSLHIDISKNDGRTQKLTIEISGAFDPEDSLHHKAYIEDLQNGQSTLIPLRLGVFYFINGIPNYPPTNRTTLISNAISTPTHKGSERYTAGGFIMLPYDNGQTHLFFVDFGSLSRFVLTPSPEPLPMVLEPTKLRNK